MNPLEKVPFATFYPRWKYLCGTFFFQKLLFQVDSYLSRLKKCYLPLFTPYRSICEAHFFKTTFSSGLLFDPA